MAREWGHKLIIVSLKQWNLQRTARDYEFSKKGKAVIFACFLEKSENFAENTELSQVFAKGKPKFRPVASIGSQRSEFGLDIRQSSMGSDLKWQNLRDDIITERTNSKSLLGRLTSTHSVDPTNPYSSASQLQSITVLLGLHPGNNKYNKKQTNHRKTRNPY